jgi:alkyldihydroxyacetonephosphate synthase
MEYELPAREPGVMKWWGWGDENIEFDIEGRPALREYVCRVLHLDGEPRPRRPVAFDLISVPEARPDSAFMSAVASLLQPDQIAADKLTRLTHAFGKSCRDMWRVRRGIVPWAPDCVIYPASHAEVAAIIGLASVHEVHLIPFGGGSNIAGCLEPLSNTGRMIASLDMRRMNRLVSLDRQSGVARLEAGALGPRVEELLNREGFTLGHFPDSFLYSTLGGWVATRSAGMQSDRYGKIEDMVVAIRMATPSGDIETQTVPRASNGIDVNHLCIGSEGTLGVITEVAVRVHTIPEKKGTFAYLFPDTESGVRAMLACQREGPAPAMMRLNDPNKTALSAAFAKTPSRAKRLLSKAVRQYLHHIRRWNSGNICLMLAGYEGSALRFDRDREAVEMILRRHGAFALGEGPGRSFHTGKFDFPYLRDYLFEHDILCDVSETATLWSNLLPLYKAATSAFNKAFAAEQVTGWVGCHVSHSYHAGASLYFTFGWFAPDEQRQIGQYLRIKKASLDAFLDNGATFSHHHAVGYEHMPWLERDVSPAGLTAVCAIKAGIDPGNIMNPDRFTRGISIEEWMKAGLPEK